MTAAYTQDGCILRHRETGRHVWRGKVDDVGLDNVTVTVGDGRLRADAVTGTVIDAAGSSIALLGGHRNVEPQVSFLRIGDNEWRIAFGQAALDESGGGLTLGGPEHIAVRRGGEKADEFEAALLGAGAHAAD